MWTPTTRRQHSRDHLRYGSDLSDAEWEIIAPFMPLPARTGRPRFEHISNVGDGLSELLSQERRRTPVQPFAGAHDVRAPLDRVING